MDVRLSPEQVSLRAAAATLAAGWGRPGVRNLDDSERAAKLDAAVAAAGWRELRAAADDGAPLAGGVEAALVAEELGRVVADTAFIGPTLAADLRRRAGAPPAVAAETVLLSSDLSSLASIGTAATAVGFDAAGSDHALALDGRGNPVLVPLAGPATGPDLTRPGRRTAPSHLGPGRRAAGDRPGGDRPLGPGDLDAWTALGLALACADLVGAMRGALGLAVTYVTTRRQYGVPVGSFQALQHLLADAHVAAEGSASAALYAAWAVDSLPPAEALAAASAAKAFCARAGIHVGEVVIQAHGGIGNTWDCPAHLYLRRQLLSAGILGDVGTCLERVLAHRLGGEGDGLR